MTRNDKARAIIKALHTGVSDVVLDQMLALTGAKPQPIQSSDAGRPYHSPWTAIEAKAPYDGMKE